MKRTNKIRLTESQLHRVIKESVERVLAENDVDESNYYSDDNFENTMAHFANRNYNKRMRRQRDDNSRRFANFCGANNYGGRLPMK